MKKEKKSLLLNLEPEIMEKLKLDSKAEFMTLTQYIKYLILKARK